MAISDEEQTLRDETRTALLKAIKTGAERLESSSVGAPPNASGMRNLAEAYAIVTGEIDPTGADADS